MALRRNRAAKRLQRTTGNVFRDLGFSAAESKILMMKSEQMVRLCGVIKDRRLTQGQAATVFGVSQPKVKDLLAGKTDQFSVDTLSAMLAHAGLL